MTNAVSPLNAQAWIASGDAVLIDVREADEFKAEHIPYATSMPLGSVKEVLGRMDLPANKKLLFQCQRGGRGAQACAAIAATGSPQEIYNVEGGIEGWKAADLPTVTARAASTISIFRQVQIVIGALVAIGVLAGYAGAPAGFAIAGLLGGALFISGLTGWCGLAILLAKMPWNKV